MLCMLRMHPYFLVFGSTIEATLYKQRLLTKRQFSIWTKKNCNENLTRTVGVINLSQFLRATLTTISWLITYHTSAKFVTSALDKSCNRDNFIFRRDLQKLRHGGLPAVTIFFLKYRDSYRRTAPPTFTPSTAGPLVLILSFSAR